MGRKIGVGVLLVVAALIVVAFVMRREPPPVPSDRDHAAALDTRRTAGGRVAGCLVCHGPDGDSPRSKDHPPANDCFRCHAVGE